MKKVLGLIGEKGSGKQTFVNFLKEIASASPRNDGERLTIRQIRFSDILAQTLIIWDLPITRTNLQKLSIAMNATFGETALANAAKFSAEGDTAEVIILDGIRRETELELVKRMDHHILIYITADQKLRYQRLKKRSEKVGEVGLTFDQFMAEEKSKAEEKILILGKFANLKIVNNGTLSDFEKKVNKFYYSYLSQAA
ncbi:AAA family ATPase [Candidatus Microgenomates bacterium]|nr:AAA family ATPase [Candidatus Microgenomates bacterium]